MDTGKGEGQRVWWWHLPRRNVVAPLQYNLEHREKVELTRQRSNANTNMNTAFLVICPHMNFVAPRFL